MINATLSNNKLLPFCLSSLDVGLLFARTARIARTFAPPRTPHCLPLTCLTYWCCVPGLAMRPTLRMSNANIPKIIKHRWLAFVCVACVCVCVYLCVFIFSLLIQLFIGNLKFIGRQHQPTILPSLWSCRQRIKA